MMFPIDRKEPGEIAAFRHIFERFPDDPENISRMLRYLCLRFDPKARGGHRGHEHRKAEAMEKSGFVGPGDPPCVNNEGDLVVPARYQEFMDVTTMFFAAVNNNDWEELCSLEFMLWEAHEIMRTPIPRDAQPDIKIKMADLKIKLSDGAAKMSGRLKALIADMADGDEDSRRSIEQAAIARKKRDLTGKVIE